MKHILLILITGILFSCTSGRKSQTYVSEEGFSVTRRYIGNFVDYCHTGPEVFGGVNLIWIRTTVFSSFGKISVFGRECRFRPGDKIYLKRLYSTPGPDGTWDYQIENDSSVVYKLSNYRYENNALVQALF
jgi:hypothetical protein